MRRNLLALALLAIFSLPATAQSDSGEYRRNTVFLELAGTGYSFSFNYDRRVYHALRVRAGVSYLALWDSELFTFPLIASVSVGKGEDRLELGAGVLAQAGDLLGSKTYLTALIGYRNYPVSNEFVFRATFTPIFTMDKIRPWGGVSFGYAF